MPAHDRRKSRRKTDLGQKDIRPSRVWIQNILAVTNQNVDICQRIPGYIFRIHGIQPRLVGIGQTSHRPNSQQICYTFFQTKIIPPALWNACGFVLQFNFTIANVPGRMNTAADFLSRLDLDPKEKVQLLIRDDIQTTPIEVHIQSSNVAEEEQFYFLPEDDIETEEQIWERKQRARKKIQENDTPQTPGEEINKNTTHPEETTVVFQTEITRRTQNPEENERPSPVT